VQFDILCTTTIHSYLFRTTTFSFLATVAPTCRNIKFFQRSNPNYQMQQIFDPVRHKNFKARVKEAIKSEFNHCCAYCGSKSKQLTLDHVLASSKGGINSWTNLVPACAKCNGSKGSKNLADWYTVSLPCYSKERLQRILNRYSVKSRAYLLNRSKGFASLG